MTAILFGLLAKYLRGQKLFGTGAFALVAPNVNVREYDAWPHMPPRCYGRLSRVDDRPWTMDWLVRGGLKQGNRSTTLAREYGRLCCGSNCVDIIQQRSL